MTLSLQNYRFKQSQCARQFFIGFALIAFLVVKAVVPPGFMTTDGSTDSFYKLCHGDIASVQLSALNTGDEVIRSHSEHSHLQPISHTASDNHHNTKSHLAEQSFCLYATLLTVVIAISFAVLGLFVPGRLATIRSHKLFSHPSFLFLLPAVRAPPQSFFLPNKRLIIYKLVAANAGLLLTYLYGKNDEKEFTLNPEFFTHNLDPNQHCSRISQG